MCATVVCFYMVAIPEAVIPTDRDRIGTPPPQRVEPYKNTLCTVGARPKVHRVERIVCFYMVSLCAYGLNV